MTTRRIPVPALILAGLAALSYALSLVVVKILIITPDPIASPFDLAPNLLSFKLVLIIGLVVAGDLIYASLFLDHIADYRTEP